MTVLDDVMAKEARHRAPGARWYGVYPALVIDVKGDPDGLGRVKITLPWVADTADGRYEAWARVATLMAGMRIKHAQHAGDGPVVDGSLCLFAIQRLGVVLFHQTVNSGERAEIVAQG